MYPPLSEEDAKKLILSLDPRLVEQVLQQASESSGQLHDDAPSVSEHQTSSSSNLDLPVNNLARGGSLRVSEVTKKSCR